MDFHLKQWRDQESEEEHQPSPAKFPRLHLQLDQEYQNPNSSDPPPPLALPLFAPCPDSKPPLPPTASRVSSTRVGGHFSMSQWYELELQALIFRHMAAGAVVPPELLQLVKKSLLSSPSYYLNNYSYSHQPSLLQSAAGYWGRSAAMDPEPGRCRRTDGKKWRCSRDVVSGQKYCERHVHRGRNRSRKPVELPVPTSVSVVGGAEKSFVFASSQQQQQQQSAIGAQFSISASTPSLDIFQLNQGASEAKVENADDGKYNGRVLRRFFDDWPATTDNSNPATSLSISTPVANPSLDFLKLSTGNVEDDLSRTSSNSTNVWSRDSQVASMGGPLAEALRSSTRSSPTSVLNQIPRSAADTTSYVTA